MCRLSRPVPKQLVEVSPESTGASLARDQWVGKDRSTNRLRINDSRNILVEIPVCIHGLAHEECKHTPVCMASDEKGPINASEIVRTKGRDCFQVPGFKRRIVLFVCRGRCRNVQ